MQKFIYIILALLFFTATTGFTVRQQDCRTDMVSHQFYQMNAGAELPQSACCMNHITHYPLGNSFFNPQNLLVPEIFTNKTTGHAEKRRNTEGSSHNSYDKTPVTFGSVVARGHAQAQSVICIFLI